jgi:hypothetical protein
MEQACTSTDAPNNVANDECIGHRNFCEEVGCLEFFTRDCQGNPIVEQFYERNQTIEQFYELDQQDRKDNLTGTDFSRMLAKYTGYRIKAAGAILGATSLKSIAICTAARLNYTEYWKDPWYINCNDYNSSQCNINDYTEVKPKEGFCRTSKPTNDTTNDTAWPTYSPTSSNAPTEQACYYTG